MHINELITALNLQIKSCYNYRICIFKFKISNTIANDGKNCLVYNLKKNKD